MEAAFPHSAVGDRLIITERSGSLPGILYLGYTLRLSPDETRLLCCISSWEESNTSGGFLSTEALLAAMRNRAAEAAPMTDGERLAIFFEPGRTPPPLPYSAQQISVLVNHINRKASAIGGRRLILGKSHHGYRLNPYL
jgi:hypothetical protein